MDAKLKAKWLKALRSGKFKQGVGRLKERDRFCCLGVLATVEGAQWKQACPYIDGEPVGHASGPISYLGSQFGIHKKTQIKLGNMNDGKGKFAFGRKSFEQLADYIEKNL